MHNPNREVYTNFKPRHEIVEVEPIVAVLIVSNRCFSAMLRGERVPDESGKLAVDLLRQAHVQCAEPIVIPNDKSIIQGFVRLLHEKFNFNTIITVGGTGPSPRDQTVDALKEIADKELPGFGELFRRLSEKELGPHIILTRASAFIYKKCVIFCLPGSPSAVELALRDIIIPTLRHVLSELHR